MNATVLPNFIDGAEGVFENMPDEVYRRSAGVSNSMLKALPTDGYEPGSPAHFLAQFSVPQEDTDALFIGRCVHSRILTPECPLPGVVEIPETYTNDKGEIKSWTFQAKACKAWRDEQIAKEMRPMKASEIKAMDGIVNAIANDPICKVVFQDGKPEVSLFKRYHNGNGTILRKARLDWVPPGPSLVDIKTCLDARALTFSRTMWQRRYYVQAALYLDLWNELNPDDQKQNFVFIAVEKFAPFAIQVFDVDIGDLRAGTWEWKNNLNVLIECKKQDVWPVYPDGIQTIKMKPPFGMAVMNE